MTRACLRIVFLLCAFLVLLPASFAQGGDAASKEKFERTFNHAVQKGEDPQPEPKVEAFIGKRLNQNGAYSFYEATDITERPFILKTREKLDPDKKYTLTGHVDPAKNNPQVKQAVFVVTEIEGQSPLLLYVLIGVGVIAAAGALWWFGHHVRVLIEDRKMTKEAEEKSADRGRLATSYHAIPSPEGGLNIGRTSAGLLVDFGYGDRKMPLELVYDRKNAVLERQHVGDKVTIYQISRQSKMPPSDTTPTGHPVHNQIRLDEPDGVQPALSRKGSFFVMCTEGGDTYVLANAEAKTPPTVIDRKGRGTIVGANTPVKLEVDDRIEIGHMSFSYRVGEEALR